SEPCQLFRAMFPNQPKECLDAAPACKVDGEWRYLKSDMVGLLAEIRNRSRAAQVIVLSTYKEQKLGFLEAVAQWEIYLKRTFVGRFASHGITLSQYSTLLLENGGQYASILLEVGVQLFNREESLTAADWDDLMGNVSNIQSELAPATFEDGPRCLTVKRNMAAAWNLLLQLRQPTASKYLFDFNTAMLLPAIRQHLIFSDVLTLQPERLLDLLLEQEVPLIRWMADIDDHIVSRIARVSLHIVARSFAGPRDMYYFGERRPTENINLPSPARIHPMAETFEDISVKRADDIFYSEDAFVEVKCTECGDMFCGGTAAMRHLNVSGHCLTTYARRPEIFIICDSFPTVALIVASGRAVFRTREDDMDGDWELFVCTCCERLNREAKKGTMEKGLAGGSSKNHKRAFIGQWRQCVRHFEQMRHRGLFKGWDDEKGGEASMLFRLATADEKFAYEDVDDGWRCSRCHDFTERATTRTKIELHLRQKHFKELPTVPQDMFYGGI
ncbi:hypothetical protein AAF712_012710, partial [Marasmius tenuissimus]